MIFLQMKPSANSFGRPTCMATEIAAAYAATRHGSLPRRKGPVRRMRPEPGRLAAPRSAQVC